MVATLAHTSTLHAYRIYMSQDQNRRVPTNNIGSFSHRGGEVLGHLPLFRRIAVPVVDGANASAGASATSIAVSVTTEPASTFMLFPLQS